MFKGAGKLIPIGDSAETCLRETTPRPITPPVVKKFANSSRPGIGAVRVFHGKAHDPDIASTLFHGKNTKPPVTGGLVINPVPKTLYQQKLRQLQEAGYFTNKKTPLGRSHDQSPGLPDGLDVLTTTFGMRNRKGLTAGEMVNPPKTAEQVEKEGQEGHRLYIKSHDSYFVGEPIKRNYKWSQSVKESRFGAPTPHANEGQAVAKSLHWIKNTLDSKRNDDFKERFQPQVGKTLDPFSDTRNVPADHTFGILMPSQNFGVGDLIDLSFPEQFLKGTEKERALVNAVQEHLKKANFQNFNSLLQAFRHYDKKGQGWLDKEDLQNVCWQLNLAPSPPVLDSLMECCDVNKDGRIDFMEFSNFLNWKGKMPINTQEARLLTGSKPSSAPAHAQRVKIQQPDEETLPEVSEPLVGPEDLQPIRAGSTLKTPRTLARPKTVPPSFATSSSLIGAVVGGPSTANYRRFGIPTVRTDLPAPRLKRTGDRTNYGDESTARDLLHPTLSSLRGVHEEHFLTPRPKHEIARIFRNVGVDIPQDVFEEAWKLASLRHSTGEVCVETFRNVLLEIQAN
ncbi:EF-hand domain-containing family member B [Conger conger]|uniref:EF-hand domain-containing family member B n=1 Tax=Conger conger TaxID=82655 RepID=UPI002A5A0D90|nr:EF-hand domain-containing family member B [Conger conger]